MRINPFHATKARRCNPAQAHFSFAGGREKQSTPKAGLRKPRPISRRPGKAIRAKGGIAQAPFLGRGCPEGAGVGGGIAMNNNYNSDLNQNAKNLRTNATKQENKLWYEYLRSYKPRFTRQRIVDNYILDFYCATAKLAVELDGSQHYMDDNIAYDQKRTRHLESMGIAVMRFANIDVDNNFEGVCISIDMMVKDREHPPNPRP